MDTPAAKQVQKPEHLLQEHEASLFRPSTTRFDPRRVVLPDSFFEPTSSELSNAIRSYADVSQRMTNATLQTRKMRQAEEERRMSRFRKVMIRVLFPDRVALQGVFTPKTPVRDVHAFVKAAVRDDVNLNFNLFVTPPKRVLKDPNATLWSEGLVPAALVYFGLDGDVPKSSEVIRPILLDAITDAPESTVQQAEPETAKVTQLGAGSGGEQSTQENTSKQRKVPKWFKSKK